MALRLGDAAAPQHLDRHDAIELCVTGLVDHAHSTFANLLQHLVVRQHLAGDGCVGCHLNWSTSLRSLLAWSFWEYKMKAPSGDTLRYNQGFRTSATERLWRVRRL